MKTGARFTSGWAHEAVCLRTHHVEVAEICLALVRNNGVFQGENQREHPCRGVTITPLLKRTHPTRTCRCVQAHRHAVLGERDGGGGFICALDTQQHGDCNKHWRQRQKARETRQTAAAHKKFKPFFAFEYVITASRGPPAVGFCRHSTSGTSMSLEGEGWASGRGVQLRQRRNCARRQHTSPPWQTSHQRQPWRRQPLA